MKLNLDSSLLQAPVTGTAAPALRLSQGAKSGEVAAGGDSVSVSGAFSLLNRYSTDRAARIDALSRAVAEGSYKVSAGDIGGAIIRHAGG